VQAAPVPHQPADVGVELRHHAAARAAGWSAAVPLSSPELAQQALEGGGGWRAGSPARRMHALLLVGELASFSRTCTRSALRFEVSIVLTGPR
jgi:hypothetical protein